MCGIWGLMSKTKGNLFTSDTKLMKPLMTLTSLRGGHGVGFIAVSSKGHASKAEDISHDWIKIGTDFHTALKNKDVHEFMKRHETPWAIFGHDRYATRGSIKTANTHPFNYKHITLLHNGSVWTGLSLQKDQTDSERITEMIAEKGAKEVLENLDGAFVCIWYDSQKQTLNIAKNDKRPFHYMEDNFCRIFASEAGALEFIRQREFTEKTNSNMEIHAVPNMVWHEINVLENKITKYELKKPSVSISTKHRHGTQTIYTPIGYTDTHQSGYAKVGNTYKSVPNWIKGRIINFFWDSKATTGPENHVNSVYRGETLADTKVDDGFPILFRTNDDKKFDSLRDKMLCGTVIGFEKYGNSYYALIQTKSIREIDAEEIEEPITYVTLKNNTTMTEEEFVDAMNYKCFHCGQPIGLDEANQCTYQTIGHKKRLICPDCTLTQEQLYKKTPQVH